MCARIAVDNIQPKEFDRLVELLADWINSSKVRVRFRLPNEVSLDFSEKVITKELEQHKLPKACRAQLQIDIPYMIFGILSGQRRAVIQFLAQHAEGVEPEEEGEQPKQEILDEIGARVQRLEENVVTPELALQFAVKRTSKNNILIDAVWDIVEKRDDSADGAPANLRFATVRITAQRPPLAPQQVFFPPFGLDPFNPQSYDALILTVTADDLRYLIATLTKASKALAQITRDNGGSSP